jgi:hypothetical protein
MGDLHIKNITILINCQAKKPLIRWIFENVKVNDYRNYLIGKSNEEI